MHPSIVVVACGAFRTSCFDASDRVRRLCVLMHHSSLCSSCQYESSHRSVAMKEQAVSMKVAMKEMLEQAKEKSLSARTQQQQDREPYVRDDEKISTRDPEQELTQETNSERLLDAASYNNIIYKMWEQRSNVEILYAAEDSVPAWIRGASTNNRWVPACVSPSRKQIKEEFVAYYLQSSQLHRKYVYETSQDLKLCKWGEVSSQDPIAGQETHIMFHGTNTQSAMQILTQGFRPSKKGTLGQGVYLTPEVQCAMQFAMKFSDPAILRCEVKVGKVWRAQRGTTKPKAWQTRGYDSAWLPAGIANQWMKYRSSQICVIDASHVQPLSTVS